MGAAAMVDQGVAHQAEEILERQNIFIAAAAMLVPDGSQERVVEDEVAGFQDAGSQG